MQGRQTAGLMTVRQRSADNPLLLDAISRLPSSFAQKNDSNIRIPLPPIYHDGHTGGPAAFITYHWKLTSRRKAALKSDER